MSRNVKLLKVKTLSFRNNVILFFMSTRGMDTHELHYLTLLKIGFEIKKNNGTIKV